MTPEAIINKIRARKKETVVVDEAAIEENLTPEEETITVEFDDNNTEEEKKPEKKSEFELSVENLKPTIENHSEVDNTEVIEEVVEEPVAKVESDVEVEIDVEEVAEEKHVSENLSDKLVKDFGEFDPKLELGNYKFPTFNLLKQYNESISVDPEELELNKNKIVDTLKNYKIGIAQIKATVGPTKMCIRDSSFTVYDSRLYPVLRNVLKTPKAKERVLFGSDFYMLQKDYSERRFGMDVRGYIDDDAFWQIAETNPKRFLFNK